MASRRLNITLDEEHARKLSQLAARVHVNEGTLARSLLSTAIWDRNGVSAARSRSTVASRSGSVSCGRRQRDMVGIDPHKSSHTAVAV